MKNRASTNIDVNELIQRINKLEIENKTLKKNLIQCINSQPPTNTPKETNTSNNTLAKDAKGNTLVVGQKVRFITKGKYHSTEGTIETIKESRVVSIDNKKNKIVTAHKNVEIISKNDKRRK